jgi:hypothetical protein
MRSTQITTVVSIIILITWAFAGWMLAYPSQGLLGKYIGLLLFYILTLKFAVLSVAIVLFLRAFSIIDKTNFFYNFIGTISTACGIIGLLLAFFNDAYESFLQIVISLALGYLILCDIYEEETTETRQVN